MMTVHCYFNRWMAEIGVCTCEGHFWLLDIEKNQKAA